ncbi:MAG: 4-hydroxy-3-methylbut-2-enyl diphosphate reductase [Gammaproteobacteria bacterium]|nr:4-hydroxy-3-methylbut-2-enyl diphosphate reductase [Gammaproteobacteria bacterium]
MTKPHIKISLASPRGFCAGVDRAIEIVERAIANFGAPIYVRHEIVHNAHVVNNLKEKGAVFVEELHQIPDGATVIFSAHGIAKKIEDEARDRGLQIFDATCPLVIKVHMEVVRHAKASHDVILIGHAGHPEVEGTLGRFDTQYGGSMYLIESIDDIGKLNIAANKKLAYVTQTTLSVDETADIIRALKSHFPDIIEPRKDDICYATQNRQDAIKTLATDTDLILVVGSPNSSNSNRLRELSEKLGTTAYLINDASEINLDWLKNSSNIGISAGASAPENLVTEVINFLELHGAHCPDRGEKFNENVVFSLPKELR